ncbi:unnamed protein product, partial [Polarella glacialis]
MAAADAQQLLAAAAGQDQPTRPMFAEGLVCQHQRPAETCGDCRVERVLAWLQKLEVTEVQRDGGSTDGRVACAMEAVMGSAKKFTFQHEKAFKHRSQVEAIASHCLQRLPKDSDVVVELGAGQALLGHAVSVASGLPLVAIDRRANADAFDPEEHEEEEACSAEGPAVARPSVRRVVADISDETHWPSEGNVVLLAKHLCGHASDIAVEAALRLGSRLSLLCLAPCCHARMRWQDLAPSSQQWFRDAGFVGHGQEFQMLMKLSSLARAGSAKQGGSAPFSKWPFRQRIVEAAAASGTPAEVLIESLGRKACRAVDEARLAMLRTAGFHAALAEYCAAGVSPDNVLLLAVPEGGQLFAAAAEGVRAPEAALGSASSATGALLEIDPAMPGTFVQRLASYLMEQQAAGGLFPALWRVAPATDKLAAKSPGLLCLVASPEQLPSLLRQLAQCPLVQRSAARLLPFGHTADSLQHLAAEAVQQLASEATFGGQAAAPLLRVAARPRSFEKEVVRQLSELGASDLLSPARFTHTLFVLPGDEAAVEAAPGVSSLRWSLVGRSDLDPSAWMYGCRGDGGNASYWRFAEVARRWPQRLKCVRSVAVWTDCSRHQDDSSITAGKGSSSASGGGEASWVVRWVDQFLTPGIPVTQLS